MRTLVMDADTLASEPSFDSAVIPFIRPPVVNWVREPLPDFIRQEPIQVHDFCCCDGFQGFSGGYYMQQPTLPAIPSTPVPEPTIINMLFLGIAFIVLWNKYTK